MKSFVRSFVLGPCVLLAPFIGPSRAQVSDADPAARVTERAFFPPPAPLFGSILQTTPHRLGGDRSFEPPDQLGDYVGEFFYPPLSTRLSTTKLDHKMARRLAAYLANRSALVNELQNALVAVQNAEPAARERELRAFATAQTPRIVAHENEAEKLREELVEGGLLRGTVDWSRDREWKARALPAGTPSRLEPIAEFQVLRAAAYYQKGLLPEQRGLLCELADEASVALARPRLSTRLLPRAEGPATATATVYFSPEMARLSLPLLPRELSSKLYSYLRDRDAIKHELREAVLESDRVSASKRDAALTKLAETQWPRLSELAIQAENLRRELVALPAPAPPPLPPQIPAALAERISAYQAELRAFNAERSTRTNQLGPDLELRAAILDLSKTGGSKLSEVLAERRERTRQEDEKFLKQNAARAEALERERKSIQADLTTFAQAHSDPATGKPMDVRTLFSHIAASDRYFDQIAREEVLYKDYRAAMLEPGLSPEQRRLLFNAARIALAQALPFGEPFPSGRFPRPSPSL